MDEEKIIGIIQYSTETIIKTVLLCANVKENLFLNKKDIEDILDKYRKKLEELR